LDIFTFVSGKTMEAMTGFWPASADDNVCPKMPSQGKLSVKYFAAVVLLARG
jgi:hypothetical protein